MLITKIKIYIIILISFVLTLFLNNILFFEGTPKINPFKYQLFFKNIKNNLIIVKNNLVQPLTIEEKKIYHNSLNNDKYYYDDFKPIEELNNYSSNLSFYSEITPTLQLINISLTPTNFFPSIKPSPPLYILSPSLLISPTNIIIVPTKKPIKKSKKIPTPTSILIEENNTDSLFISNPLDQPYYNPKLAYKCYNSDSFISMYGGGEAGQCYEKAKKYVEANLTSVTIMGKTIPVHKKAYPAFKAVADKLKNYKDYKINTIGSYVFRCNVNASTSNRFDLCNSGCVLSTHAFGIAVDINWEENCNGCSNYTMPAEIVDAFESYGFRWGGRYKAIFGATIDPMHFEYLYDLCKNL